MDRYWHTERSNEGLKKISQADIIKAIGNLYLLACLNERRESVEREELMEVLQPREKVAELVRS